MDRCLFISSPWLLADYYVLHRLSVPRHPSCALSSLTFNSNKFECYKIYLLLEIQHYELDWQNILTRFSYLICFDNVGSYMNFRS